MSLLIFESDLKIKNNSFESNAKLSNNVFESDLKTQFGELIIFWKCSDDIFMWSSVDVLMSGVII